MQRSLEVAFCTREKKKKKKGGGGPLIRPIFLAKFYKFLCISTFEHGHLEPWCYGNACLLLLSLPAGESNNFVSV